MKYRLKPGQESFQVVDGPHAGKQFRRGATYTDIPPEEKKRFEKAPEEVPKKTAPTPEKPIEKEGNA